MTLRVRRCAVNTLARAETLQQPPALSAATGASATGLLPLPFVFFLKPDVLQASHTYLPLTHSSVQADAACTAAMPSVFGRAHVLSLCGPCSCSSREDNGAEGEGRLPNDTGATSANASKGFLGRASTWAPGAMNGGMWSPDALTGLYGGWKMAPQLGTQPADLAAQQGAAATASRMGTPGVPEGDWRSVVQAAAAAASQLEISKLSARESARSVELGGDAPLASPPTSLCKAQRAPAIVARFHHKVTM